jgi:hypothetical protein
MFWSARRTRMAGFRRATTPTFCLDLGFHGEEVESMTNSASHELCHVGQQLAQRDLGAQLTDRPDLGVEARERYRARAILLNLVIEGMAGYVPSLCSVASTCLERREFCHFVSARNQPWRASDSDGRPLA